MIRKRYFVALGAISAALGACSSEMTGAATGGAAGSAASATGGTGTGGSGTGGTSTGGSGNSSATGGVGGGTGGSTTGGTGGVGGVGGGSGGTGGGGTGGGTDCVPGIPGTSQIPRLKNAEYAAVVWDLLGVELAVAAPDVLSPDSDGSLTPISWNGYLSAADKIATAVMTGTTKSKFIACDPAVDPCLSDTIKAFGRKAFRRPLTPAEVTSFERLKTVTPAGTPAEIAEAVLYTFLASPSFISLPELVEQPEGTALKLSSYEVATRLSMLLWGSAPDDILNAAADADQLQTKAQILEQAKRMVVDRDKTGPVVAAFHKEAYAGMVPGSHWGTVSHDSTIFPKYTTAADAPGLAELEKFFEEVAFQNGAFKDLFLSNVAFVNQNTAPLYGLDPAGYGAELERVELDKNQRPGFLTRVGFLSSFSAPTMTSPILRGAFIATRVLGTHMADPPSDALTKPVPPGDYKTQRARIEALTDDPRCIGCHAVSINPPGFVLEHYDAVGSWQDTDLLTGPIDGSAEIVLPDDSTKVVSSPIELMTELGNGPFARRRYAEQWVTFATGREPNANDTCTVVDLDLKLAQDGYKILDVLADLTQADSFRLRTVGN